MQTAQLYILGMMVFEWFRHFFQYGTVNNKVYNKRYALTQLVSGAVIVSLVASTGMGTAAWILVVTEALSFLSVLGKMGKPRVYLTEPGHLVILTILMAVFAVPVFFL